MISVTSILFFPPTLGFNEDLDQLTYRYECNGQISFFVHVGYLLVMICMCVVQGFRARSLPENFNEGRFIFLSSFIAFILLVMAMLVYASLTAEQQKLGVRNIRVVANSKTWGRLKYVRGNLYYLK